MKLTKANKRHGYSVATALKILTLAPIIIIEVIFSWYHIDESVNNTKELLLKNGNLLAQQISNSSAFYIVSGDYSQINTQLLQSFIQQNYIVHISIQDESNNTIAIQQHKDFDPKNENDYLIFKKNIFNDELYTADLFENEAIGASPKQLLGYIKIYLSKEPLNQKTKQIFKNALLYSCILFLIAFLLVSLYIKHLTAPFSELLKLIKNAEHGNLLVNIKKIEDNEIGILQDGFNKMISSLLANRNQLDQKVNSATEQLTDMVSKLESNNSELETSKQEAQKANQIKSDFLANMSHEIRTPINGINGFINLLSNSELQEDQKRYTQYIQQSSQDLTLIVNEILDFSKIESGMLKLTSHSFDLIDCIESVRDHFFPAALDKNIGLFLSIYADIPRFIIGDELRLKQILINLIGNAIKFTDSGHIQIKVSLSEQSKTCESLVQIDIIDTGLGIEEQDIPKLFKAFQQIDSKSNRNYSGTGLGLVISNRIIKLMGGNINLTSKLNKGSTFSLTMPLEEGSNNEITIENSLSSSLFYLIASNKQSLSEIQSLFTRAGCETELALISNEKELTQTIHLLSNSNDLIHYLIIDKRQMSSEYYKQLIILGALNCNVFVMDYLPPPASNNIKFLPSTLHSNQLLETILQHLDKPDKKQYTANKEAHKKRILVVDDNPINLSLASELLMQWGHLTIKASSAKAALEAYKKNNFDLVLMDIQMPDQDGVEGLNMIHKCSEYSGTPIIALTANAFREEEKRLLKLGFEAYISKPIDEHKLNKLIQNVFIKSLKDDHSKDVDVVHTIELSGGNNSLSKLTLSLLKKEIPIVIEQFKAVQSTKDIDLFKSAKHRLEGTTCYVSLPKLKEILNQISINSSTKDMKLSSVKIISALESIQQTLNNQ